MSSTQKEFAQISSEIKYFNVLDVEGAEVLIVTGAVSTIMSVDAFNAAVADTESVGGAILRDIGSEIIIFDESTRLYTAKYRKIQVVDGDNTNGAPYDYPVHKYVKVWSADGNGVYVTRTGPSA